MSTLTSKPTKRYNTVEFVSVLVFIVLFLTLIVLPFTGSIHNPFSTTLGAENSVHVSVSTNTIYSFSADQQYWGANCSHGWSSNSTCDDIVARSQSCSISVDSIYCTEYENYLNQFSN